jgi:hypothetical protein
MGGPPIREFGKRRPVDAPPSGPVKRSSHVALLWMGAFAVGGAAYAVMPRENCQPPAPGMATAAPVTSPAASNCTSSHGYGGHGSWGGSWSTRQGFFSSDSASGRSSSGASDVGSGGVSRGGFGSFARAFSAHFSGGG